MNYFHLNKEQYPPNFEPCGVDSPSGCSGCPQESECYPEAELPEVVTATAVFVLDNGTTEAIPLTEVLYRYDTYKPGPAFDFVDSTFEEYLEGGDGIDVEDLLEMLERFEVQLPVVVNDPDGDPVEVDFIGGVWHIGEHQDLESLRHLEQMMSEETWGETYDKWDW